MGMRVNVKGIRGVQIKAESMRDKVIKATHGAMVKGALIDIETVAKKKITQDKHIDTGRLRASIHTTYKGMNEKFNYNDMQGQAFEAMLDVRRKEFNVFVGTDVLYSKFIERLDSFLYFAFKHAQPKIRKRIKQEIKRSLRR